MEIAYILSMRLENAFQEITNIATTMILLPYILSAAFLLKYQLKARRK